MLHPQRQLLVIVSLDVRGFTRLVQENERATLVELAAIRKHLLLATLRQRHGHVFKTMGDGALIEFPNIADAVGWTLEFQQAMAARNARRMAPVLEVRAAIALADIFVEGEDRFGAAIAFVVRLQEVAPPGGIAITHSVRWQLGKALQENFTHTMKMLKSIDEPVEVWLWHPAGLSPEAVSAPAAPPPAPSKSDKPSIVVLRFDNLSGDPAVEPLVDGVVEEITATLSRVRDFTVIARNSANAYRTKPVDLSEVSRVLGVRYVLQGSVRRSGDSVRITAQLLDATDSRHLWSERYDGNVADIFDLEDRIAVSVVGALQPSIRNAEIVLAQRRRPENIAAYDLVMRALPNLWAHRKSKNATAIALLSEAMRLDPDYPRAAAFAAWAHAQQVAYNWTEDYAGERAVGQALIDGVTEAVDDDPTALTALATGVMLLFADRDRAKHFIDRALALDPNHAWGWTRLGFLQVYGNNPAEGRACFERAIRLSPLDPFSFNCFIGLGLASFAAGRPDEAITWTRRAISQKPGVTWMFRDLATFLAHAGRRDEAREALARFLGPRPSATAVEISDSLGFMADELRSRYVGGLVMAGLPC